MKMSQVLARVWWTTTNHVGSVEVHQLARDVVDARCVGVLSMKNELERDVVDARCVGVLSMKNELEMQRSGRGGVAAMAPRVRPTKTTSSTESTNAPPVSSPLPTRIRRRPPRAVRMSWFTWWRRERAPR